MEGITIEKYISAENYPKLEEKNQIAKKEFVKDVGNGDVRSNTKVVCVL